MRVDTGPRCDEADALGRRCSIALSVQRFPVTPEGLVCEQCVRTGALEDFRCRAHSE